MKNLAVILILLNQYLILSAQYSESSRQKFGVRAGINYSLINFNKAFFPPSPAVKNIWKPGFTIGALLQLHLNDRFTIEPEYAYTQMNGKDPRINTSYTINYLSLPIFIKIKVLEKLSILAGPQFDLLISAKENTNNATTSIEHQTEERSISGIVGVELQVYRSFFVDARYQKGFNHIGIQRSDINEFKWAGVMIAVGMHF